MRSTNPKTNLINKNYGKNFQEHLLRQYELFYGSSEQISSKRMSANKFYLGVNAAIFSIAGYLSLLTRPFVATILSIIGIFLCTSWILMILSYRNLNASKFKVIHEMEEHLPSKPFKKEDEYLNNHHIISRRERMIPILFIVLYSFIILIFLPSVVGIVSNSIKLAVGLIK